MAADDEIRTSVAIERKFSSIIAETRPQTAEVDDDLTVGPLPPFPAPIPAASMIARQKVRRNPGP